MPLPWIKNWLEGLDDPKLTRMSLAERGAWECLLKLAGKCNAGGKIVSGGQGLTLDEIADALHIKTDQDRGALASMIVEMEKRGSLEWNEGSLFVIHYEERQRIPPSSQPESVAERVRLYRERKIAKAKTQPIKSGEPTTALGEERPALEIWETALGQLQLQVSKSNYRTWLVNTRGLSYQGGQFVIGVPTTFVAESLEKNQRSLIERVLTDITHQDTRVRFQVTEEDAE